MLNAPHVVQDHSVLDHAIRLAPLHEAEIDRLGMPGGRLPEEHAQRWAQQQAGALIYLVAWHGTRPVGHVLLRWGGAAREPMASILTGCPHVSDLYVIPEYQGQGIGTRLMDTV